MTIQDHGDHAAAAAPAAHEGRPSLNGHPAAPKPCADTAPRSLREVAMEWRDKIDSFLAEEPATPLLRAVQSQLRISMAVTEEALERYKLVPLPPLHLPPLGRKKQITKIFFQTQDQSSSLYHITAEKTVCALGSHLPSHTNSSPSLALPTDRVTYT